MPLALSVGRIRLQPARQGGDHGIIARSFSACQQVFQPLQRLVWMLIF